MEAIMSSNGSMLEVASMLINNANASSGAITSRWWCTNTE